MEPYRELCIDFSTECESLKREVHTFAEEVVRPAAALLDRISNPQQVVAADSPLWPVLKAAYEMRYHGVMIPEQLGGLGLSALGVHVLLEELGWGSAGIALGLVTSSLPMRLLIDEGRSELIDAFVKPFAANRDGSRIGCWAVSEPRHGSNYFLIGSREFRHYQWATASAAPGRRLPARGAKGGLDRERNDCDARSVLRLRRAV